MLVFGPGKYRERPGQYLEVLLAGHRRALALASGLLAAVGAVLVCSHATREAGEAIIALAVAAPFVLFTWLMRRACYVRRVPLRAAAGAGIYMVCVLSAVLMLDRLRVLSVPSVFGAMGLGGLIAGSWLLWRLRRDSLRQEPKDVSRCIWGDHWTYGRWALASGALSWIPANACFLVLPVLHGLAAGAALKALLNLATPLLQVNTSVAVLLLPVLARQRRTPAFHRSVRTTIGGLCASGLVYALMLGRSRELVIPALCGEQYAQVASLVWVVALLPVVHGIGLVLWVALSALERPDRVFWGCLSAALAACSIGVLMMALGGVLGALLATLSSSAIMAGVLAVLYSRSARTDVLEDLPCVRA